MNLNEIIEIYKDDTDGAIDALLNEGVSKIRSLRYYDSEPFFEKAYLLSSDRIKKESLKENDKSKINQNEMKFADVFSKYTFSLFIQNTKNPLKFMEVVTKFKKQNDESNKDLSKKVMEVVLDDCDTFYPRYCSDLNNCFYMTWSPFPYMMQKLDTDSSGLSLDTLIKYLKIVKRCSTSLKNSTINEVCCSCMNNFFNHYEKEIKNNQKKLRTVDETKFKTFIFQLQKSLKGANLKQLEKSESDVLLDFLMSEYLGKQFYALWRFNSFNSFSKDLIDQFHQRDIINKLLYKSNLHHELIEQFSIFLSKLFEYNFYDDSIIEQLWSKTFEKTDELEDYFNAWTTLQSSIPAKNQKYFWNLVLTKTPSFSSSYIRTFLIKIAPNCSEKDKVEMVNLLWKSAIESSNSDDYVDIINEYMPNDNELRTDLEQRCFSLFESDDTSDSEENDQEKKNIFGLKLLIKIWKFSEENKAKEDFDFLLKNCKLTDNSASTFLSLLSTIAKNFVKPLTEEELELIKDQIVGIISTNSIFVFNFIQGLLNTKRGRLFTSKLLYSLFEWMTKLKSVDSVIFKLIRYLYEMIYSSVKKNQIDDADSTDYLKEANNSLWNLLYRTDIPDVADFLVKIYMKKCLNKSTKKPQSSSKQKKKKKSKEDKNEDDNDFDSSYINDFISNCFKKLNCFGSLTALYFLISEIEDSLDLEKYEIQRNVFNGYKQTLTIFLTRDYVSKVSIQEGTSYYSFRKIVRDLIKANDSQINLMVGSEKLDRNHVFKNNEKIKVFFTVFEEENEKNNKKNATNSEENSSSDESSESETESESTFSFDINSYGIELKKENLPSQILNQHRNRIKSLLDNDDTLICEAALNLLNYLSIDDNEVNLLKTNSDLFDIKHPFYLVYRLNLLANLVNNKDLDVLNNIFNSHLFSQLINIVLKMDRNSFTKDEYYDLLLETVVDINKIGNETKELRKPKRNCMKELIADSNSSLSSIMNWIIEEEKFNPINTNRIINFLVILVEFIQIDKRMLLDHQLFPEFFDLTLFNDDESIRSTFYKVLTYIKTTRIQEFSLSRLNFSRKANCSEYFMLIQRIAKFSPSYENSKFLFDNLVDTLNDNLFIYNDVKVKTDDQLLIDAVRDLCADLAYPDFIKGIIDNLEFLFPLVYQQEDEEEQEEDEENLIKKPQLLINILVDKIIFNTNRYVYSPPSLLNLVKMILNRFPSLFPPLIQSLTKFAESIENISDSYVNLYSSNKLNEKGLNNLGCTCYLNASIQQLFHIKEIRNAILSYEPETDTSIDDDWICQLQLLMANLKYAPLSSIDATGFVGTWKMYGNEPIDPNEQQDAVEFLQILLDRLDESLPGKPISKCVRGQIIHTIKQINGDFQSQSFEDFITFTLEVINKKNFSESFDAFLEPDVFDGDNKYNVEDIGQIDAARYHAIKKAPEILIFQLKRFDFDLSSLTRKKINSEYQIDMDVDISRLLWNKEDNKHCNYELFGIIEHSGGAEGGHYKSFIKSADVHDEAGPSSSDWKVYNDSRVSNVDEKEVIKSATGGVYTRRFYDPITQTVKTLQSTKIDSAYILFYRKLSNKRKAEEEEEKEDYPIMFMPEIMLRKFFRNMKNLILRHVMFSNEYIKFIDYISKVDNICTFKFIYQYTMKSITSSKNNFKTSSIIQTAMKKASSDINFACYILKKKDNLLINTLLNYTEIKQAKLSVSLANAAISVIYESNKEKHLYNEDVEFIDSIISRKEEIIQHIDKFDFVFQPFFFYLELEDLTFDLSKKYLNFFMDLLESIDQKDKQESIKNQRNKNGKYKSTYVKSSINDSSESNIVMNKAHKKTNVSFVKDSDQINIHSRIDFKNTNMMHVFKSILVLIEKNDFEKIDKDYYHSIKTKVINRDFMELWSQSRHHAFNFNSLIIHFLKDDKQMTDKYFNFLSNLNAIQTDKDAENDTESNEVKQKGKLKFAFNKKSKNKPHKNHQNNDFALHDEVRDPSRKGNQKMTIQKLAAIFVNLLTFKDTLTSYRIQWFFEFTEKLKWSQVEKSTFLRESSSNIRNNYKEFNLMSTFNPNQYSQNIKAQKDDENQVIIDPYPLFDSESPYLITKYLLCRDQFIRLACVSFIHSVFPSFPKLNFSSSNSVYAEPSINTNATTSSNEYDAAASAVKFVKESESKVGVNVDESDSNSADSDASEHSIHKDYSISEENSKDAVDSRPIGSQKNCELYALIKLFKVLMDSIKEVANLSKEVVSTIESFHEFKAIPTDTYFDLLSWATFHLLECSNKVCESSEKSLNKEEAEFLKNFDLSSYSATFSDLITKFSSFKNNVRTSVVDLLRFIYIAFKKCEKLNEIECNSKSKKTKKNVIVDHSNSLTYLNAVSRFPASFELSMFIDNVTVYFLPVITPFADKIEGHILKSKFVETMIKMSMSSAKNSINVYLQNANYATEENYYATNVTNVQTNSANIGNVISGFLKKLKPSEKLCGLLWKKRKSFSWGRSSLLLQVSYNVLKNGGWSAVNYFTDFGCVHFIINEFQNQHEASQFNFNTWEMMLKIIHLYNRSYVQKQNGRCHGHITKNSPHEEANEESSSNNNSNDNDGDNDSSNDDDDNDGGEVKSSDKNTKVSHNFLKKFNKYFIELWKENFKFVSIVNDSMQRAIRNYNLVALAFLKDIFLNASTFSAEISTFSMKIFSAEKDKFYSSLYHDDIRKKYAKMELQVIHLNGSKIVKENDKKAKKNKQQKSQVSETSNKPHSNPENLAEREARRLVQTKVFNCSLLQLFVNEIENDEVKSQVFIDFLTNFNDISQIDEKFASESIEFLKNHGYKMTARSESEREENQIIMTKKEKKKLDQEKKNEKDKNENKVIQNIIDNVNRLIEKEVLNISKSMDSKDAQLIMINLTTGEKLFSMLNESLNANAKFVPIRKQKVEKALNALQAKRQNKEIYEQLFEVVERILLNEK